LVRLADIYTGRILKGDKPVRTAGPAGRPRLIINLKTAKVIGLTVPPPLIALCQRGDRMKLPLRCMSLEVAHR
jgi:hypothetical protein